MNAINFIKHYGLNTAIRITEDSKNDDFWDTETGFYTDKNSESCVCLSDLKRLVESLELVKSCGGIINAKYDVKYLDLDWDYDTPRVTRLRQAIADYEAIYCVADMGDDTHIENHVSPNCKVGVK